MTEQRNQNPDPAGSSRESDLGPIMSLVKWISHTEDTKAMAIGINAIKAILKRNPHLRQLKGFMSLMDELHEAQEVLQARELAASVCSQYSTPRPLQQKQQRTELAPKQCELPSTQQQLSTELSTTPQ
ncbi:unnamed protein product [Oreochromis niloticus]|nr:unnamed protein product [Mustela putorius furo]